MWQLYNIIKPIKFELNCEISRNNWKVGIFFKSHKVLYRSNDKLSKLYLKNHKIISIYSKCYAEFEFPA